MTEPEKKWKRKRMSARMDVHHPVNYGKKEIIPWPWDETRAQQRLSAAFTSESSVRRVRVLVEEWAQGMRVDHLVKL